MVTIPSMTDRYDVAAMRLFIARLFEREGIAPDRASIIANGFLEADLLGFTTHGLVRVPASVIEAA